MEAEKFNIENLRRFLIARLNDNARSKKKQEKMFRDKKGAGAPLGDFT